MQELGEVRKSLWEKERTRLKWGLPQKTRLSVKINPLGPKAQGIKGRMRRYRNYYGDDEHSTWLYYNSQTRRSEELEQRAKELGLKIIQGEE